MPVRINLLPRYVVLRKIFKRALIACVAGVAIWAIVLLLVYADKQIELRTLETSIENIEPAAKATEAAQRAKKQADDKRAPLDEDVNFIMAASQTGAERSIMLDLFRPYIYPGSVVSKIDLSDGKTATITAMVRTPDDYARFITSLRGGTAPEGPLFAKLPVGTNGVPGFPTKKTETQSTEGAQNPDTAQNVSTAGGQPTMVVFPLSAEAKGELLNPVTIPAAPGIAAANAAPQDEAGVPPGTAAAPGAP